MQTPFWKTMVAGVALLGLWTTQLSAKENLQQELRIGNKRVNLRPPHGFKECSKATPFLTRYFELLTGKGQVLLGGYLTDKEAASALNGVEPRLWHIAFAYTMTRFAEAELSIAEFGEIRKNYRDNIEEAVRSSGSKSEQRIRELGGATREVVSSEGVFHDSEAGFAYLSKVVGERTRVQAVGLVLVRGKVIGLSLNKVYSSEVDTEWTKSAMKWWIHQIETDNP